MAGPLAVAGWILFLLGFAGSVVAVIMLVGSYLPSRATAPTPSDSAPDQSEPDPSQLDRILDRLAKSSIAASYATVGLASGDSQVLAAAIARLLRESLSAAYEVLGDWAQAENAVQQAVTEAYRTYDWRRRGQKIEDWFLALVARFAQQALLKRRRRGSKGK